MGKFIIHDDKKVIEFFVVVTNQMTRAVDKRALISIRFYLSACKNLTKKKLDALSDATSNFFHFMQAFWNKLKLCDFVNVWMVEDRVQLESNFVTCGIFQMFLYDNWFNPNEKSKTKNKTKHDQTKKQSKI